MALVEARSIVLLVERDERRLEHAGLAGDVQGKIGRAERGPIRRREERDGDGRRREVGERKARADRRRALGARGRRREHVLGEFVRELHLDVRHDAVRADRPARMEVYAAAVLERTPPRVREDSPLRRVPADRLDRDARVRAPLTRKDDGAGAKVLCHPSEAAELRRRHDEPMSAAVELRFNVEEASELAAPVVRDHFAHNLGVEVRQAERRAPGLHQDEPVGRCLVFRIRRCATLVRPQCALDGGNELEEELHDRRRRAVV